MADNLEHLSKNVVIFSFGFLEA